MKTWFNRNKKNYGDLHFVYSCPQSSTVFLSPNCYILCFPFKSEDRYLFSSYFTTILSISSEAISDKMLLRGNSGTTNNETQFNVNRLYIVDIC